MTETIHTRTHARGHARTHTYRYRFGALINWPVKRHTVRTVVCILYYVYLLHSHLTALHSVECIPTFHAGSYFEKTFYCCLYNTLYYIFLSSLPKRCYKHCYNGRCNCDVTETRNRDVIDRRNRDVTDNDDNSDEDIDDDDDNHDEGNANDNNS